jgi:hypothetical protein
MSENTTKETQISGEFQSLQSSYRLNGRNYLKWSQIVKTFLKGKGKINHLMDNPPSPEDPKFTLWDEEDSMIMSWLWNSIMPEVCGPYMFLVTAKDIWDAVRQTYSKVKDAALIYEIKMKLSMTKQGNMMVIEYYNIMKSFWLELDYYQDFKMQCSEDAVILKNYVERERIFEFLAGLNIEFDQMRVQILGKESLPSLNEVFSVIRAEEGRRTVMLEVPNTEGSAMMITNSRHLSDASRNQNDAMNGAEVVKTEGRKFFKDDQFCNYCKKTGHTKETCWKLHGKPPRIGRNGGQKWNHSRGHAHLTNSGEAAHESSTLEVREFNKEEIERLRTLLNTMEKPSGSCSLAQNGKIPISHVFSASNKNHSSIWVIDSGATDHMTYSAGAFTSYQPCPSSKKITVADGSLTTVAGQGTIPLNPVFTLQRVLHVPNLTANLLSIRKLIKDINCSVTFFLDHCIFQDLATGRTIGQARVKDGLYMLGVQGSSSNSPSLSFISVNSNKTDVWNHHRRLGHLSFKTLRNMFPSLFKNLDVEQFHCEICEFAKHHRVPFPISDSRSVSPFTIIHSDIWGPYNIPNISGAKGFVTFIDDCT